LISQGLIIHVDILLQNHIVQILFYNTTLLSHQVLTHFQD
jgi:hypothetical protein